MSEEKTMEQILKEKDAEIATLKKRLADRNPVFNSNLLDMAEREVRRIELAVGAAIAQALGKELVHALKCKKISLHFETSLYGPASGWVIIFTNKEDRKDFAEVIADMEMKKFKESLDNFAWAVQSQGGGAG